MKTLMLVIAAGSLWAQGTVNQTVELQLKTAMDREIERTKFEVAHLVKGPVVKDAPYSAEAVTETVQVLGDGNRIENRSSTKIFRDSEGRERREEGDSQIFISDPVEGTNFTLRTDSKVAQRGGTMFVMTQNGANVAFKGAVWTAGIAAEAKAFNVELQKPVEEKLGMRTIEGVEAEGTRTTVTIPADTIGNVRPIEIVDERWYSPDLQVIVYSRNSDPRTGTTEYRLINIQRGEQPRTLFEVPADYDVPENMKKNILRFNVK